MPKIETVKVKSDAHPSGYITVNKDQADKYESKSEPKATSKRSSQGKKGE